MITLTGLAVNRTQKLSIKPGTTALISTTDPYSKLRSDIYHAFIDAFNKESAGYARVASVKPFEVCLNKSTVPFSRVGYYVPQIDLILDGGKEWSIFGSNSMVQVGEEALCLGFVDGGMNMEHGMVIGGFQIENNFLLFDMDKSRLGISSSLLFMRVTCNAFNFTRSN
ncbi:basic 7S globulin 2 [Carex littledalei]|uniref:Basic 7S globulin 2 n=1 Tax=Carex littledalei TaxID=544730 RepID=A0A833VYF4_9POAL|nr:basic 7S globulin 2 [Carex littledalei]